MRVAGHARLTVQVYVALALLAACSQPGPPSDPPGRQSDAPPASDRKTLNMALSAPIDAFSIAGTSSESGGIQSYAEIHSQALFTSDRQSGRPVPRLLAEQPSMDNGGLAITPDGKMVATYRLRPDIRWADGPVVTARDLLFTYRMRKDPSMTTTDVGPTQLMESAAAPDDQTFVVTWRQPYYQADALGLRAFWPLPAHLLETDYTSLVEQQRDSKAFLAKPYWTSAYVHVGPFKLTELVPQVHAVFDAVDDYFLGRPKIDRIVVRQFAGGFGSMNSRTALSNVLAGSIDVALDHVLPPEQGLQIKAQWDSNGRGRVYFTTSALEFLSIQFNRSGPDSSAPLLDPRVRIGLFQSIDRGAYAEILLAGIPDQAAHAILAPDNPLYPYVKDGWKQRYPYDEEKAAAAFIEAGWQRGPNGMLVNRAGERLGLELRGTQNSGKPVAIVGDMWRRTGVDTTPVTIPPGQTTDREYRQQFPGVEITSQGSQDSILTRLECIEQPTAQNHFSGSNRGHWCNMDYDLLVAAYRTDLREPGRGATVHQIQEVLLDQLPIMLLNYQMATIAVGKHTTALEDDFHGGAESGRMYGTYSRNAHEWELRG